MSAKARKKPRPTTTRDAFPFMYPDEPEPENDEGAAQPEGDPNAPALPVPIRRPIGPAESGEKPK